MNFDDIKLEYNEFVRQFDCAHGFLYYFIEDMRIFLKNYYILESYNEIFADNLEINLAELGRILKYLDCASEFLNNITLSESTQPKAKIYKFEDYIIIPDDYDKDIYVDLNFPLYFDELGNDKNNFK